MATTYQQYLQQQGQGQTPSYLDSLPGYGAPQANTSLPLLPTTGLDNIPVDTGALSNLPAFSAGPVSFADTLKGYGQSIGDFGRSSGFLDSLNTKTGVKTQGWGGPLLGAASAIGSGLLGLKQYGLAKDQFDFQKQAYQTNLANQAKLTNSRLADRQAQRVANNPNSTSVADYLKQYGV